MTHTTYIDNLSREQCCSKEGVLPCTQQPAVQDLILLDAESRTKGKRRAGTESGKRRGKSVFVSKERRRSEVCRCIPLSWLWGQNSNAATRRCWKRMRSGGNQKIRDPGSIPGSIIKPTDRDPHGSRSFLFLRLHHFHEYIMRNIYLPTAQHFLFTFFLLFKKFHFSSYVSSIQIACNIFTKRL